jgi:hypothetical protein
MTKIEQIKRLASEGFLVPRTEMLSPDLVLDHETWGRYVVVKPWDGAMGRDVRLLRTEDVAAHYLELTFEGKRPMVIQPYIEHSDGYQPNTGCCRCSAASSIAPVTDGVHCGARSEVASDPSSSPRTTRRSAAYGPFADPEIIALGERAHSAFPNVRPSPSTSSQRVPEAMRLEANQKDCHGASRQSSRTFTAGHIRDLYSQFNALDRTAELLIEKTRAEAT